MADRKARRAAAKVRRAGGGVVVRVESDGGARYIAVPAEQQPVLDLVRGDENVPGPKDPVGRFDVLVTYEPCVWAPANDHLTRIDLPPGAVVWTATPDSVQPAF